MSKERKERFTPGPWVTDGTFVGETLEYYMAMVVGDSKEERIANAALVATAPEMYAFIEKSFCEICAAEKGTFACELCDAGRVLKKARGEGMKEHPILFSTDMVRAILDGRKTVTRRVMKPRPHVFDINPVMLKWNDLEWDPRICKFPERVSKHYPFKVGDRLWVREAWNYSGGEACGRYVYRASTEGCERYAWRPSIHMPRAASRITLEVVSVTAERLRDITEEDARAEGVEPMMVSFFEGMPHEPIYKMAFEVLWDKLNAQRGFGWDKNPWVWRNGFKVLEVRG